jgi:hypothetical protein
MPLLKINYILLAPWIVLSLPSAALMQQSILVAAVIVIVGTAGTLLTEKTLILAASVSLLALIVWGKIAVNLYGLPGPDSALLLFQFMLVIFLMEASTTALTFDSNMKQLEGKDDHLSSVARTRALEWARTQLFSLGKLTLAAFGLSLGLLIFGSLLSVSINQIAFSGVLALAAVVAIFILLTFRREPSERRSSRN